MVTTSRTFTTENTTVHEWVLNRGWHIVWYNIEIHYILSLDHCKVPKDFYIYIE